MELITLIYITASIQLSKCMSQTRLTKTKQIRNKISTIGEPSVIPANWKSTKVIEQVNHTSTNNNKKINAEFEKELNGLQDFVEYSTTASSNNVSMNTSSLRPEVMKQKTKMTQNYTHVSSEELEKELMYLQKLAKTWVLNVRSDCRDNHNRIQEVVNETKTNLVNNQISLYGLQNTFTIRPKKFNVGKGKLVQMVKSDRIQSEDEYEEIPIPDHCQIPIKMVDVLREYWKESLEKCLRKCVKKIHNEESKANLLKNKIDRLVANSPDNFTGMCDTLQGTELDACLQMTLNTMKDKLDELNNEIERNLIEHEIKALEISLQTEMCHKVGEAYKKTMNERIRNIAECLKTALESEASEYLALDYHY